MSSPLDFQALVGRDVNFHISDPWDVGGALDWGVMAAKVLAARPTEGGGAILLQFGECDFVLLIARWLRRIQVGHLADIMQGFLRFRR